MLPHDDEEVSSIRSQQTLLSVLLVPLVGPFGVFRLVPLARRSLVYPCLFTS
jgi:hypothetical protein